MIAARTVLMWMMVTGVLAQEPVPEPGERPRVLCGRKLADTRMLYCLSVSTNTKPDQKRSDRPWLWRLFMEDYREMPWLERQQSQAQAQMLAARGKRMPGLVDECCYKPCYLSELFNYC